MNIDSKTILNAYANGVFPMARSVDDKYIEWIKPKKRGIIPIDNFYIPKSLKKTLKKKNYEISIDTNFELTISKCAEIRKDRENTWINKTLKDSFIKLFEMGYAHSIEVWRDNNIIGGLYGLTLGSAFFGESMFSSEKDGSKIALCYLIANLRLSNFLLLDIQFVTKHLKRFGAIEVSDTKYSILLENAITKKRRFCRNINYDDSINLLDLHSKTQIS